MEPWDLLPHSQEPPLVPVLSQIIPVHAEVLDIIMVCRCGTVSPVDITVRSVLGVCMLIRLLRKISKYEVGILRAVLVATQVLWLLRLIDRRLGVTCCLYHQGVHSTGSARCRLLNICRRFAGACCFCLEGLCAAGFLFWLVNSHGRFGRAYCLLACDVWSPGLDYWFFLIWMYELFYCCLNIRLNRTV